MENSKDHMKQIGPGFYNNRFKPVFNADISK